MVDIEQVVATIQARWGQRSLQKLRTRLATLRLCHLPTGFPELDRALGIGGLPCGQISEIFGRPTSGATTLAYRVIASAQEQGKRAVYFDIGAAFDPDYASHCGVQLERLLLVRPENIKQGLNIIQQLVLSQSLGVLVLDCIGQDRRQHQILLAGLIRLRSVLAKTLCALLLIKSIRLFCFCATVRLQIERERWLYRKRNIKGYSALVSVLKNKYAPAGNSARITIALPVGEGRA